MSLFLQKVSLLDHVLFVCLFLRNSDQERKNVTFYRVKINEDKS